MPLQTRALLQSYFMELSTEAAGLELVRANFPYGAEPIHASSQTVGLSALRPTPAGGPLLTTYEADQNQGSELQKDS